MRMTRIPTVGLHACLSVLVLSSALVGPRALAADASDQYRKLTAQVSTKNLAETVTTLAGFGSRVAGYPGDAKAADYVEGQFKSIFGSDKVNSGQYDVTVPIDKGASITVNGITKPLSLEAAHGGTGVDPWGNERVGVDLRGHISRKDFGMTFDADNALVSDKVAIELDFSLVKAA